MNATKILLENVKIDMSQPETEEEISKRVKLTGIELINVLSKTTNKKAVFPYNRPLTDIQDYVISFLVLNATKISANIDGSGIYKGVLHCANKTFSYYFTDLSPYLTGEIEFTIV